MIETEFRATVHCDHMRWDSAAIRAGQFMANVAAGSLGCLVTAGPYPSVSAARESAKAAGWWLIYPWPSRRGDLLLYCPLHRDEARQFWGETQAVAYKATLTVEPCINREPHEPHLWRFDLAPRGEYSCLGVEDVETKPEDAQ